MAEDIEGTGEAAKSDAAKPNSDAKNELPEVEAPALSPAADAPESVPEQALLVLPPAAEAGTRQGAPGTWRHLRNRRRYWQQTALAASVMSAAGVGVLLGSILSGPATAPKPDAASLHRQQAMQQTIQHLGKEVAALKVSLAASRKAATSEIAKLSDRLSAAPEFTGSIPEPPKTVQVPLPRRVLRAAAMPLVPDWSIHDVHNGFVYVKGHGDIYQAARGAPLPGLGPIAAIERRDGRWVVVTSKGLIVSPRDRPHFQAK